ncbi:MAG: glycosyltransferase [Candidatus Brocadiaceae bacterium]|nr:glycosyltransferase [Candidatus Brocadiaceae bacterium]
MIFLEYTFWLSIIFIVYAYMGYPLLLIFMSKIRNRPVSKGDINPDVSFIITAYNEEKRIKEKIEGALKQEYPRNKLDIIIASDCSNDRTDEIVKSYESQGVRLVRATERLGKEATQKLAIDKALGEIFVFSDVATRLSSNGISNIVKSFADSTVGCVSSEDRFVDSDGSISGEGAYVRYEMFLRNLEMKVNTLVGLSGSFFAARKDVCKDWAIDLQSDFNTLLNSIKIGLRGVSDPESIGYYKNIIDEKKEFNRKVRTVIRGISVFMKSLPLLNPFRYGLFSWQLFSHKLCRWLVPFAMILTLVSNVLLIPHHKVYKYIVILQALFYAVAFVSSIRKILPFKSMTKIPFYFVMANLSILVAWYRYLKGERLVTWEPSKR